MPELCASLRSSVGRVVRCRDGEIRRMDKLDRDYGYYSIQAGNGKWASVGAVSRDECIDLFLDGIFEHKTK